MLPTESDLAERYILALLALKLRYANINSFKTYPFSIKSQTVWKKF